MSGMPRCRRCYRLDRGSANSRSCCRSWRRGFRSWRLGRSRRTSRGRMRRPSCWCGGRRTSRTCCRCRRARNGDRRDLRRRNRNWRRRWPGGGRRRGRDSDRSRPRWLFGSGFRCFGRGLLVSQLMKMLTRQFRVLNVQRARVRLLLRDADFRQEIDQHLGLDFQFSSQFIDTNLIGVCHSLLTLV